VCSSDLATDRVKFYVNGVEQDKQSTSYPFTQNRDTAINGTSKQTIGSDGASDLSGYLADFFLIDGSQLEATSFGAYDDSGVWQAAAYSGTYGTNGFHLLDFANEATIGHDSSGNNNDFAANNFFVIEGTATQLGVSGGTSTVTTPSSNSPTAIDFLVVAGGGGGTTGAFSGGGGAGGYRTSVGTSGGGASAESAVSVSASTSYNVSVGAGGAIGSNGANSVFATITSTGGGRGGGSQSAQVGGSGGGGGPQTISPSGAAGTANQGFAGANGNHNNNATNGGGGAGSAGSQSSGSTGGAGGNGISSSITGTAVTYAAGGRGGNTNQSGVAGARNTGNGADGAWNGSGAAGGSGVVVLRYADTFGDLTVGNGLTYTFTNSGGYKIYTFIANYTAAEESGIDVLFDVPTNGDAADDTGAGGEVSGNYCVFNPLDANSQASFANGNLDWTATNGNGVCRGTIAVSSGKWYWEYTYTAKPSGGGTGFGILEVSEARDFIGAANAPDGYSYYSEGSSFTKKYNNGSNSNYGASFEPGDVIGFALDMGGGTITFYKNGASQGQAYSGISGTYAPALNSGTSSGTAKATFNAGQRAFAYSAPSGFSALCTTLLPTPTIADGSDYFDVDIYSGTGASHERSNFSFNPDWLWFKSRNTHSFHTLVDVVRGGGNFLRSNTADSETTGQTDLVTSFDSDGFTMGANASSGDINQSGRTYVCWGWDAGSSTVSNTDGSITSSVRANPTAGFSIVTYSGVDSPSSNTVGPGLNVAPVLWLIKQRSGTGNWSFAAADTNSSQFNDTEPTSSVFTVGSLQNINDNYNYIAYCFAPVAGYSAFGSYVGTGSSPNFFVFTGMRPAFILTKGIDDAEDWYIRDTARSPFNEVDESLRPNDAGSEYSGRTIDILSNGFKIRDSDSQINEYGKSVFVFRFC